MIEWEQQHNKNILKMQLYNFYLEIIKKSNLFFDREKEWHRSKLLNFILQGRVANRKLIVNNVTLNYSWPCTHNDQSKNF